MYVYQVTNLSTKEFYIGLSTETRRSFDGTKRLDPMAVFPLKVSNGHTQILNVEKRLLAEASGLEELSTLGAELAKKWENNPLFLGLKS